MLMGDSIFWATYNKQSQTKVWQRSDDYCKCRGHNFFTRVSQISYLRLHGPLPTSRLLQLTIWATGAIAPLKISNLVPRPSTGVVTRQRWLRWRVNHDEITVASHQLDCEFKNGLVAVNSETCSF